MRWFRRERTEVDLDPIQVAIVTLILQHGPAPDAKLWEEAVLGAYATRPDFLAAVSSLVERGILEPRLQPEEASTWFVLGPLGKRLKGKVPLGVRAGVTIYL